jgi:hypothetical protein
VTAAGVVLTLSADDWLRLVRDGAALFASELAARQPPPE